MVDALSCIYPGEPYRLYQSIEHPAFDGWTVTRSDARLDMILRGLYGVGFESGPVLEVGCCTGRLGRHLARHGYEVHGIDGYATVLDAAKLLAELFDLRITYELRTDALAVVASRRWGAVVCPSVFHPMLAAGKVDEVVSIWRVCLTQADALILDDAWPGDAGAPPWAALGFVEWLDRRLLAPIVALGTTEGRTLYAVTP